MSRSLKKGQYIDPRVLAKVMAQRATGKRVAIKTWSRACVISPEMVGLNFSVHNGKDFLNVLVDENMVGHRLGEFAPTRKFVKHGGKMAKDQETKEGEGGVAAPAGAGSGAKKSAESKK